MNLYADQVNYHLVNILLIFCFSFLYTMIKLKTSLNIDVVEKPEAKDNSKEEGKEQKTEDKVEKKEVSFMVEVIKNFFAGMLIYILYIFYKLLKP